MKKTILTILLGVLMIFSMTGCGGKNNSNGILGNKSLKASDLSIEDFKWETVSGKCDGYDCYVLSLTNNSKYDIIGVNFSYKVKDEVTDSQLNVYEEFMKEHDGYIDENDSPKNVTLIGEKNKLVQKGEQLTDLRFTVGYEDSAWYDYPTDEQFNLMEPKELQLGVISGNKLYIAYYSFKDKSWKLDQNTADVDTWSNTDVAKKISKPNEKHHVIITDDEDEFKIYSYGITKDIYKEYTEKLRANGFVQDEDYSSHFEGKDENGYEVTVWFDDIEESLSIRIEKE